MSNNKIKIVMLCGNRQSSKIMYNGLKSHADIACIIVENKPSGKRMIQRRIKNIGLVKTTGQLLFLLFNKLFSQRSENRIKQLMLDYQLDDTDFPSEIVKKIDSVNSDEAITLLKAINPDAVVINGTRIISKQVLSSFSVPFINTHNGITPRYRGTHGGYWALANNDSANCGVTVHLVDQGIDTGGVLYQAVIQTNEDDNIDTYPFHQIAKAIPLVRTALDDIKENKITLKPGVPPSGLWYHPTLFEYASNWLQKKVK